MDVKEINEIEYIICSCCQGEVDGNGDCRNFCEEDCKPEYHQRKESNG